MDLKKLSRWVTYCSIFFAVVCPSLGFAQPPGAPDTNLDPTKTDLSIQFLSNIFGVVDGVLHGSGSQIFGAMFGVFNSAVLTLGTAILGYTLFVATLKTAHEGESLGREWSSIWVPLRTAAGFALMLPKASGYCIIQILVMWTVVQGVGAANLVWNAALDYLAAGGAIVRPQQPPEGGGVKMAGDILRAETCMLMIEEALNESAQARAKATGETASVIPSFMQTVTTPTLKTQPGYDTSKAGKVQIQFPGKLFNSDGTEYKNFLGACGSISWESAGNNNTDPNAKQISDARNLAVAQVIANLSTPAQQLASDYGPFPNAKRSALKTRYKNQDVLIDASNDFQGIMAPAYNSMKGARTAGGVVAGSFYTTGGRDMAFIEGAKKEGWIMAGSYYQQLVSMNRDTIMDSMTFPETSFKYPLADSFPTPTAIVTDPSLTPFFNQSNDNSLPYYIDQQTKRADEISEGKRDTDAAQTAKRIAGAFSPAGENKDVIGGTVSNLVAVVSPLSTIIAGYVQLISQTGEMGQSIVSPVTAAAILGSGLLGFVASAWIVGAVTMFGVAAIASICPAANPFPTAISVVTAWFVPLLTVLLVLMFVMGATLTYYIPLIPYILFLFGGIGWIIGVLESIAAAPLVALGIAYPEEHQVLGKSQPAVMLLANIFIRPSLMIIGFIAGISLSYVAVWLLNRGFKNALVALTPGAKGWAWLFMPISIMSIYTVLIVEIINRAFSLIHVLPDEVLRWVGGGHRQLGAETSRAEEAVRGGATGDIKQGGQAMAQGTGDSVKARGAAEDKKWEAGQGPTDAQNEKHMPGVGTQNQGGQQNNPGNQQNQGGQQQNNQGGQQENQGGDANQ